MSKLVTSRRTGYALWWVIMMVAVIAALVAASAPSLATIDQRSRAVRTAAQLKAISNAFVVFDSLVGNYPGNVSELTNTLTTSHRNSCRGVMTTTNVANWATTAPFANFYVSPQGQWTDVGRVRDSIPARTNPPNKADLSRDSGRERGRCRDAPSCSRRRHG